MITEETIWNYIDGTLDAATRQTVAQAIAGDNEVKALYQQINTLHLTLQTQVAELPSANLMANIMRAVKPVEYAPASKVSVLPVVWFALPLLVIMVAGCVWLNSAGISQPLSFHFSTHAWNSIKLYAILADVVLLLMFVDSWLGRDARPLNYRREL